MWLKANILTAIFVVNSAHEFKDSQSHVVTDEERLLKHLFQNYDNDVRPVGQNNIDVVNVSFNLALIQIVSIVSKSEMMTVSLWVRQEWDNPFLTWQPEDFGNITSLNMDPIKIWFPDIILYNNADGTYAGGMTKYKTKIILEHTGRNKWYSPGSFTSTCAINVRLFPFDRQKCTLKFGSWTYAGDRLVMFANEKSADLNKYIPNGEWDLINVTAVLNVIKYSCCKDPFYDVTFNIHVHRKSLYYIFNLMVPCALISVLTLMKFFLPVESGEKIGLGVTVLLAMTVFLLIVAESLPSTSAHIPLLGEYFISLMLNTSLALVASCFVLACYYKNPRISPMSQWFRKLIFYLRKAMFMKTHEQPCSRPTSFGVTADDLLIKLNGGVELKSYEIVQSLERKPVILENGPARNNEASNREFSSCGTEYSVSRGLVTQYGLSRGLGAMSEYIKQTQYEEQLRDEWRSASLVLDLFCFYMFFFLQIISIFVIFIRMTSIEQDTH